MREAVFVSYARTGMAKAARGGFNMTPAMSMAAHAISNAVEKSGVEPEAVEDVALRGRVRRNHGRAESPENCRRRRGALGVGPRRRPAERSGRVWQAIPGTVFQ